MMMTQNVVEALLVLAVGMAAVFSALLLLAGMIWALEWVDRTINSLRIRKYAEKVETHRVDDAINDEIVAVIAAAVATAVGRAVKIRKVRFLSGTSAAAWAVTGRLNIMASHAIARRKTLS